MDIMKHVEFSDLIRTHVIGPLYQKEPLFGLMTARYEIQFESLDKNKNVVFDTGALDELNKQVSERSAQFEARDPRAKDYIREFAERVAEGLYKSGLVIFDDISEKEAPDDPYADLRTKYDRH